jgi:GrpB-like predicted nucleotidyltransferase (UPF0157 family)
MVIQPYDDSWPEKFESIRKTLADHISAYLAIEHVGSTSIVGMEAKPIIDIDIVIEDGSKFEIIKDELSRIGYVHVGDQGIAGREVFKRDGSIEMGCLDQIVHHLYVCTKDNEELKRHLHFRNMLRAHEALRREYIRIKHEILEKVGTDNRKGYVDMKEQQYGWFIDRVLKMRG